MNCANHSRRFIGVWNIMQREMVFVAHHYYLYTGGITECIYIYIRWSCVCVWRIMPQGFSSFRIQHHCLVLNWAELNWTELKLSDFEIRLHFAFFIVRHLRLWLICKCIFDDETTIQAKKNCDLKKFLQK